MTKFEIVKRELENKTSKEYTIWKSPETKKFYLFHHGDYEERNSLDCFINEFELFGRGEI